MRNKRIRMAERAIRTANSVPSHHTTSENTFAGSTVGLAKFSEYLSKLPKTEQNK